MHILRFVGQLALLVGAIGCASKSLVVQSTPDQAEVSIVTDAGRTPIGKTPLTVGADTQSGLFSNGGLVEVRKDGFFPEIVILPGGDFGKATNVSIRLSELRAAESCSHSAASSLARGVAMAQQQILSKRYTEAESTLKAMLVAYPNVSVLYDLMGNMHYMQRDTARSLEAYKRSYEIEPGNTYTERMIRKLSSMNPMEEDKSRR